VSVISIKEDDTVKMMANEMLLDVDVDVDADVDDADVDVDNDDVTDNFAFLVSFALE